MPIAKVTVNAPEALAEARQAVADYLSNLYHSATGALSGYQPSPNGRITVPPVGAGSSFPVAPIPTRFAFQDQFADAYDIGKQGLREKDVNKIAKGLSGTIRATGAMVAPIAIPAAAIAPAVTIPAFVGQHGAMYATEKSLKALGAPEGVAELGADVAGGLTAVAAVKGLRKGKNANNNQSTDGPSSLDAANQEATLQEPAVAAEAPPLDPPNPAPPPPNPSPTPASVAAGFVDTARQAIAAETQGLQRIREAVRNEGAPRAVQSEIQASPSYYRTREKMFEKMAVDPDLKTAIIEDAARWEAEHPQEALKTVTFDEVRESARQFAPGFLMELDPNVARHAARSNPGLLYAARQLRVALSEDLVAASNELQSMSLADTPPKTLAKAQTTLAQLERKIYQLDDILIPVRSEAGRSLRQQAMDVGSFDPSFWLQRFKRLTNRAPHQDLPLDVLRQLETLLQEGRLATEAGNAAGIQKVRADLAKLQIEASKTHPLQAIIGGWKAGMLSGLKTHARNVLSIAENAVKEEAAKVPAALLDYALEKVSGVRSVGGVPFVDAAKSASKMANQLAGEWRTIMQYGAPDEVLAAVDGRVKQMNTGSAVYNKAVNSSLNVLALEDRAGFLYAYDRSLTEQMKAAKVQTPTEAMRLEAAGDALDMTFNKDNVVSSAIENARRTAWEYGQETKTSPADIRKQVAGKALWAATHVVSPFSKVPGNLTFGLFKDLVGGPVEAFPYFKKLVEKTMSASDQRRFVLAAGRSTVTMPLAYWGWQLGKQGYLLLNDNDQETTTAPMTGSYIQDPGKRAVDEAAGRMPGAIRIGGQYHQINFTPSGMKLMLGAALAREANKPMKDDDSRLWAMLGAAGKTLAQQTALKGMSGIERLVTDPEHAGASAIGGYAGSIVPGIVYELSQVIDPRRKDTKSPEGATEIGNAILNRTPMRSALPDWKDVFGETTPRQAPTVVDRLNAAFNPMSPKDAVDTTDKTVEELVRVQASVPPAIERTVNDTNRILSLEEKGFDAWARSEQDQKRLIDTLNTLPEDVRKRLIDTKLDYRGLRLEDKKAVVHALTQSHRENETEYRRRKQVYGVVAKKVLDDLVKSDVYRNAVSDDVRRAMVDKAVAGSRQFVSDLDKQGVLSQIKP